MLSNRKASDTVLEHIFRFVAQSDIETYRSLVADARAVGDYTPEIYGQGPDANAQSDASLIIAFRLELCQQVLDITTKEAARLAREIDVRLTRMKTMLGGMAVLALLSAATYLGLVVATETPPLLALIPALIAAVLLLIYPVAHRHVTNANPMIKNAFELQKLRSQLEVALSAAHSLSVVAVPDADDVDEELRLIEDLAIRIEALRLRLGLTSA